MKHLNTKLSLIILGSLLATSIITGTLVIHSQLAFLKKDADHDGEALATTVADMCVERMIAWDPNIIQNIIKATVLGNPQLRYIQVYDDQGKLLKQYPEKMQQGSAPEMTVFEHAIVAKFDGLPDDSLGKVMLGLSNDRVAQLMRNSAWQFGVGTVVTFSLLAVVLWASMKKNVIKPLAALDSAVLKISTGDLETAIHLPRKDEMGRLATALEGMRSNLKQSYARIAEQVTALQELDRMKDEFLANTSHELKTPLNGIIGIAESIAMGSYGEITKEQQEPVELISSCANRLWKMTESILKFSQLHRQDPSEETAAEPYYIADHLQDALADVRANAEKSGLSVVFSVPKDLQVVYKRNELEQVVRILADNAVKYTPRGIVQIIAQKWDGPQQGFQIAVRDTGLGIPKDLHEKIFEPFVQGFRHETRAQGGVGLGLSIAAKLVEQINAEIVVESEVGSGTSFTVLVPEGPVQGKLRDAFKPWLPLHQSAHIWLQKQTAAPSVVSTDPQRKNKGAQDAKHSDCHILVVDDESVNREVVWQALREEFRVTRAVDGPSALQVLRSEPVDLVLLDIMMPGMSGYDVLQIMKEEHLLEKVPVIVLSAKASREAVVKGLELGASDYLGKPFHRAELLCRIHIHLELKKQRDQLELEVTAKTSALQVAEQASRVKTQFLSNMSHEIRTPLNGIMGFLELTLDSSSNPEQKEYLEIMKERTQSLLGIVNDILDVAKIESKAVTISPNAVKPLELLKSAADHWGAVAARKDLKLNFTQGPGLPAETWTDGAKLTQIINNLISNAVKFTAQGSVGIAAKSLESSQPDEHLIEIKVTDSGIGIPSLKLEDIFQPFSQVDPSNTREHGGTGLGLSISRAFARMLGGDVKVESQPGKGSVFTLTFRGKKSPQAKSSAPAALVEAGKIELQAS